MREASADYFVMLMLLIKEINFNNTKCSFISNLYNSLILFTFILLKMFLIYPSMLIVLMAEGSNAELLRFNLCPQS